MILLAIARVSCVLLLWLKVTFECSKVKSRILDFTIDILKHGIECKTGQLIIDNHRSWTGQTGGGASPSTGQLISGER